MPVACLILIIASLVTGMATTTWYMIKAQEAQNRAVSARALTLGQVSHTRYNFEQSRRLMIQRDAADRLSILANRAIATRVTWAYENSLITASLRDDLLNTLLRCWNERLAEAESLANSDGKASENGSENSELLSFKHRVTLIALQSSELQARMGHHKAAVQRLEGIIADTPLDQTLFLESARIYSICASCVPPTEIELRASYLHSGKSCILPMLDDAVQQIQAWKQLEERGLANHTIMPDLAWLEVVADDPDFRPLNIHEEATHWHSQWIAHQDKHKPNRFEAESDTKSSMTIQKSNSF